MKKAFVIQAVGESKSATRDRADRVLEHIIEPACTKASYRAERADEMVTRTIVEPIISALNTYPLVVADLGAPPWNPNVLMEVGFRLATGRPIVFVADVDPKPDLLPLHLRNVRIHVINSEAPSADNVEDLKNSIRQYGPDVKYWASDYPTIEFSISRSSAEGGRFIFANDEAARLYGLNCAEDIIGKPLIEIEPQLQKFIPAVHYKEYEKDQNNILAKVWKKEVGPKTAEIPLWFRDHDCPTEKDQIYWPLLVQYRYYSPEDPDTDAVMRVIFVNVKEWDQIHPDNRTPPQVLKVPDLFRVDPRPVKQTYDIFLSYNSKDNAYAKEIFDLLEGFGLKVWYDKKSLVGQKPLSVELLEAVANSRAVFVVIGRNRLGSWQGPIEVDSQLLTSLRGKKPMLTLLLPDIDNPADWTQSLPLHLQSVFAGNFYYSLPSLDEFRQWANSDLSANVVGRLIRFIVDLIRCGRM